MWHQMNGFNDSGKGQQSPDLSFLKPWGRERHSFSRNLLRAVAIIRNNFSLAPSSSALKTSPLRGHVSAQTRMPALPKYVSTLYDRIILILTVSSWVVTICGVSASIAVVISLAGIHLQLRNYRKPGQQRLIVRIQLMIPLYAVSCYVALRWYTVSRFLEPFREIYEAFVIYTFFSLLTHLLGGERNIVILTSGREPVKQPPPFGKFLPSVDISDPYTLLAIKRGILQYVWLKPFICGATAIMEIAHLESTQSGIFSVYFIINFIYNISVTISLYDLALFWKCLYQDLAPFRPWGKFLCVKLIIFASYWQGMILGLLAYFGVFTNESAEGQSTIGYAIQNALLCLELIGFAIGHWHSFSWTEYSVHALPGCARLYYWAALRDVFGLGDLKYDFEMTFYGDDYDYRNFDSIEALIAHPSSHSRMARFNDGLRFTDAGKQRYWLPKNTNPSISSPHLKTPLLSRPRANSITSTNASTRAIYANSILTIDSKETQLDQQHNYNSFDNTSEAQDEFEDWVRDEEYFRKAKRERPYGDKNYPVIYDTEAYANSPALQRLRREAMARQRV